MYINNYAYGSLYVIFENFKNFTDIPVAFTECNLEGKPFWTYIPSSID